MSPVGVPCVVDGDLVTESDCVLSIVSDSLRDGVIVTELELLCDGENVSEIDSDGVCDSVLVRDSESDHDTERLADNIGVKVSVRDEVTSLVAVSEDDHDSVLLLVRVSNEDAVTDRLKDTERETSMDMDSVFVLVGEGFDLVNDDEKLTEGKWVVECEDDSESDAESLADLVAVSESDGVGDCDSERDAEG
jgi:hypothetical protein